MGAKGAALLLIAVGGAVDTCTPPGTRSGMTKPKKPRSLAPRPLIEAMVAPIPEVAHVRMARTDLLPNTELAAIHASSLADDLRPRLTPGFSPRAVMRRDANRYYQAISAVDLRAITPNQWKFLRQATAGTSWYSNQLYRLWSFVDCARERFELVDEQLADRLRLVKFLRDADVITLCAVVDKLESFAPDR